MKVCSKQETVTVWIEPGKEVVRAIYALQSAISAWWIQQLQSNSLSIFNYAQALPPWFLFTFEKILLPSPPPYPCWLPKVEKLSDRIMHRDRSAKYFASPKFIIQCEVLHFTQPDLLGQFYGLKIEQTGGRLPDLGRYNSTFFSLGLENSPSLLQNDIPLHLPLLWTIGRKKKSMAMEEGELLKNVQAFCIDNEFYQRLMLQKYTINRSAIHLVKINYQNSEQELQELCWESLAQIDLTRFRN